MDRYLQMGGGGGVRGWGGKDKGKSLGGAGGGRGSKIFKKRRERAARNSVP